ncbi:MAG: RHS repeat-associated core domain-containing protein, partial [Terriglobales bacterium]
MFREYNSEQGRWWTPDPAGLAAVNPANPQSWNEYSYANNNPLTLVDPLGTCPSVSKNDSSDGSGDDEASGEFGPYVSQDEPTAGEQATGDGNCTSLDGVDLPPGLFGDLGGIGGGWGGGGSMSTAPTVSIGGQSYQIVPNPYGGYCYQGQVDQYICDASSYHGELGLGDPNLIEAQIGDLNAALARSSTVGQPGGNGSPGPSVAGGTSSLGGLGQTVTTFAKLMRPLQFAAANTAMLFTGAAAAGFGYSLAVASCLEPTPLEPLTCAAGGLGGLAIGATGVSDLGLGVYFFKKFTLPAFENWGGNE